MVKLVSLPTLKEVLYMIKCLNLADQNTILEIADKRKNDKFYHYPFDISRLENKDMLFIIELCKRKKITLNSQVNKIPGYDWNTGEFTSSSITIPENIISRNKQYFVAKLASKQKRKTQNTESSVLEDENDE